MKKILNLKKSHKILLVIASILAVILISANIFINVSSKNEVPANVKNSGINGYIVSVNDNNILTSDNCLWSWNNEVYPFVKNQPYKILDNVKIFKGQLALTSDDTLWGWGLSACDNTHTYRKIPKKIAADVETIFSGDYILKKDKSLWKLKEDEYYGFSTKLVKILDNVKTFKRNIDDTNTDTQFALKMDGSLWIGGDNTNFRILDKKIKYFKKPLKIIENVKSFEIEGRAVYIIKNDGSLWGCGRNSNGELGKGDKRPYLKPTHIMDNVKSIISNDNSYEILKENGEVWQWKGIKPPHKLLDKVKEIQVSDTNTFALTYGNSLWAWDLNRNGEIGDGTRVDKEKPVKILDDVIKFCCNETSFALTSKGELFGWGKNSHGELGDGTMTESLSPNLILDDVKYFKEFNDDEILSNGHSQINDGIPGCAEKKDGSIWVWGEYYTGKESINNLKPVEVKFDKNYIPKNIDLLDYEGPEGETGRNRIYLDCDGITVKAKTYGYYTTGPFTISNGKITKKLDESGKYSPPIIKYQDYNGDGVKEIFLQRFWGGSTGMYHDGICFLNKNTLKEIMVEDPCEYIKNKVTINETKESMNVILKNGNAFYNLPRMGEDKYICLGIFVSYKVTPDKIIAVVGDIETVDPKIGIYTELEYKYNGTSFVVKSAKLIKRTDGSGPGFIYEEE